MPTEPKAKWMITEEGGEFDILRNGRSFAYNIPTVEQAITKIKRSPRYQVGDSVKATDEFGNRIIVRL